MEEQAKVEGEVKLILPKSSLEFAEFYAELGGEERDALLTKILIEQLRHAKEQVKALPYLQIPELY